MALILASVQASLMALGLASVQASLTLLSFFHGFSVPVKQDAPQHSSSKLDSAFVFSRFFLIVLLGPKAVCGFRQEMVMLA